MFSKKKAFRAGKGRHFQIGIYTLISAFICTASAKVQVVTSIPDLADITGEIGGKQVSIFSLARGTENIHYVRAKSSFLPKLRRADLVICLGLEMEKSWLPDLVKASRNPKIKQGKPGWIEAYRGLEILEKPAQAEFHSTSHHRLGNPHFNTGPYCGQIMAENIAKALIKTDKSHEEYYKHNLNQYRRKLREMESRLKKRAAPLRGITVVTYHADLAYFCRYFKMELAGTLEPKPGEPPNVKHLAALVQKAKKRKVKLVLYNRAQNSRLPRKIARQIGASPVCFANMVGASKSIKTWIELQEYNLDIMLNELEKKL